MFVIRLLVSLFEFVLAVVMSGVVIYITYRVFIRVNPDFDMELEIRDGNTAVGVLVGSILFSASMILREGMAAVVGMFRTYVSAPGASDWALWQLGLLALAHLTLSMVMAVITISMTLRLFGKLTTRMEEGKLLKKGNVAVGVLLGSVVLVAALYVSQGVSAVSKALVPQPSVGQIKIMK